MRVKYLILGSGPCGLGAGHFFKKKNCNDFLIIEKENYVGGLATSFKDPQGFFWDIGGHVQFSHYKYFDQAMIEALGENGWLHHQREAWVWIYDRFVPYPFQNNIHKLPQEIRDECLNGLLNIKKNANLQNFKDWIDVQFGDGIAKHFLYPYNFKVWAFLPHEMNFKWIGERVSVIDIERIKKNIELNRDDVSWGPNNTFQFPKFGGTGAIWESMAKIIGNDKILLNSYCISVDPQRKKCILKNGQEIQYEYLLNTTPLDHFCSFLPNQFSSLAKKSSNLLHSSSHIVGVGVRGKTPEQLKTKCWMYFPENNCPFYRVTVFSNYSPNNVPAHEMPCFSLMAEVSSSTKKEVDKINLINDVITGMVNTKLISKEDQQKNIISTWSYSAPYGYPTPSLERDKILAHIIPELQTFAIYSRGRFGGWKYEVSNQDHTFMQGVEWAKLMIEGTPEETYKY